MWEGLEGAYLLNVEFHKVECREISRKRNIADDCERDLNFCIGCECSFCRHRSRYCVSLSENEESCGFHADYFTLKRRSAGKVSFLANIEDFS